MSPLRQLKTGHWTLLSLDVCLWTYSILHSYIRFLTVNARSLVI